MSRSISQQERYLQHLAEVNQSNTVVATEDICNEAGAILVPKGTPVTKQVSLKIARHKLFKSLESTIALQKSIDAEKLTRAICRLLSKHNALGTLKLNQIESQLRMQCRAFCHFPLLTQKLTVLAKRLPAIYYRSLANAYTALLLTTELQLDERATHVVFSAALMSEIGLLHIDPDLVTKQGKITPEQWRSLQDHVVIGAYYLAQVPGLPKAVARAVAEHHEQADGFGYPNAKQAEQLNTEGQVVGMAATIGAIYKKYVLDKGYSLSALVPVLQVNATVHPSHIQGAAIRVLHKLSEPFCRVHPDNSIPQLVKRLIHCHHSLCHYMHSAEQLIGELVEHFNCLNSRRVDAMFKQLKLILITSGLLNQEQLQWLERVCEQPSSDNYSALEHHALLLDEVDWQCHRLNSALSLVVRQVVDTQPDQVDLLERCRALSQQFQTPIDDMLQPLMARETISLGIGQSQLVAADG